MTQTKERPGVRTGFLLAAEAVTVGLVPTRLQPCGEREHDELGCFSVALWARDGEPVVDEQHRAPGQILATLRAAGVPA